MKNFMKIRNKSIFHQEIIRLSSSDLHDLFETESTKFIDRYNFYIDHVPMLCYLTKEEINEIEGIYSYYETILPATAVIDPNIFNKTIFHALSKIGYTDMWMKWKYGVMTEDIDMIFRIFLNMYGDTLNYEKLSKKIEKL